MRTSSFLLLAALAIPPSALAQTTPAQKEASVHFQRGIKLFDEQDFRAALIEFRRAFEIAPNPNVHYNIGQACYQLQDYACAKLSFERYLAEGNVPEERRKEVTGELQELQGRIATLFITASVKGAEISIDDVLVGKSPLGGAQMVSAGRRKVSAVIEGQPPVSKVVDVAGGDVLKIELTFAPPRPESSAGAPLASTPAPTPSPPSPAASPPRSSVGPYVALAAGGLGVAVGSVFGLLAVSSRSRLDESCGPSRQCPPSSKRDLDDLKQNANLATAGFVLGGVGLGAGLVWLLAGGEPVKEGRGPRPWIGTGAAGVRGSF